MSNKKIEKIDLNVKGNKYYQNYAGVLLVDGVYYPGAPPQHHWSRPSNARVLNSYALFEENHLKHFEKEFKSYPKLGPDSLEEKNKQYEQDSTISPKVIDVGGYRMTLDIGALNYRDVVSKLNNPVSSDDTLDVLVDNEKLFFMDSVKFPRRKLSLLTDRNGKINNISTVRSPGKATKIIANKYKLRERLKLVKSDYKNNGVQAHSYGICIQTTCIEDSPKKTYKVGDKLMFYCSFQEDKIAKLFIDSDFKYANREHLKTYHKEFLRLIEVHINNPQVITNPSYRPPDSHWERTQNLPSNTPVIYLSVDNIELVVSNGPLDEDCYVDKDYIDCINQGLTVIDVSKIYSVIGNEILTHDQFLDTDSTLTKALQTNNQQIIKMMLESLTSYDIDSSIFYLSLIFRNADKNGLRSSIMNTSVSSLYNLCNSKAKFGGNTNTSQIIYNLSNAGYKMEIPLSFLLLESGIENEINRNRSNVLGSPNSQSFSIKTEYEIALKDKIIPHIILDIELESFNKAINGRLRGEDK